MARRSFERDIEKKFGDCSDRVKALVKLKYRPRRGRPPKRKPGRPSKYDPVFSEILPELFSQGESVTEVATELGIVTSRFYEWAKKYPEFKDALNHGKQLSESWWLRAGRAGAVGAKKGFNGYVYNLFMVNRFGWKTNREKEFDEQKRSEPVHVMFSVITPERAAEIREKIANGI